MPATAAKCIEVIEGALKDERNWRTRAKEVIKQYKPDEQCSFNILHANTAVLAASLFSNNPRPQIRRRWIDPKPAQKAVSQILERSIEYFLDGNLDTPEFSNIISSQITVDLLLAGRMVTRVRYKPINNEKSGLVAYQGLEIEEVDWEDFCHSDGRRWREVTWIAFRHYFTDDEWEAEFKNKDKPPSGLLSVDAEHEDARKRYRERRNEAWELWDKEDRKIKWIDLSNRDEYLLVADDPLRIPGFWPIAKPLLSIATDSLEPIPEYLTYQSLAEELDTVTEVINEVASAICVRGAYDASIPELREILKSRATELIPVQNVSAIRDIGGLKNAIWLLPIKELIESLVSLSQYREGLKLLIYELTGLSDLARSSTDPNETATAQRLKAQYSNLRVSPRQAQLSDYALELIRIMAHIIAEHFEPSVLEAITGVELPSEEFPGVTWQEVIGIMRNELILSYSVDIETDSTIADMMTVEQAEIEKLLGAVTGFITAMAPIVAGGAISIESARDLLLAGVRKYRFGSEVEAAIESMGQQEEAMAKELQEAA